MQFMVSEFKIDKCKFMRFTRSRAAINCSYNTNSVPLTIVSSHKHLGGFLSRNLSWKSHVLSVTAKGGESEEQLP